MSEDLNSLSGRLLLALECSSWDFVCPRCRDRYLKVTTLKCMWTMTVKSRLDCQPGCGLVLPHAHAVPATDERLEEHMRGWRAMVNGQLDAIASESRQQAGHERGWRAALGARQAAPRGNEQVGRCEPAPRADQQASEGLGSREDPGSPLGGAIPW